LLSKSAIIFLVLILCPKFLFNPGATEDLWVTLGQPLVSNARRNNGKTQYGKHSIIQENKHNDSMAV